MVLIAGGTLLAAGPVAMYLTRSNRGFYDAFLFDFVAIFAGFVFVAIGAVTLYITRAQETVTRVLGDNSADDQTRLGP